MNENSNTIFLSRPYIDKKEIEAVKKVLESGWTTKGPMVEEFENKVKNYLGVKHAIATSSCTTALHLALLSCGIKEGDDVLVADYTFPATGHTVKYCGANPIFVDIDPKTYNLNPKELRKKYTKKTKVIIVVHTFGQSADMNPIMKFAKKKKLMVIEDAACAMGSKYKGNFCGTMGDIGCFSFHGTKGIVSGEGGVLVTNDDSLAYLVRSFGVFGQTSSWDREKNSSSQIPVFESIGYNYKMSDINAAVASCQMDKLEKIIKKKNALAKYWNKRLKEIDYISAPFVVRGKGNRHNYQGYSCLVSENIERNKLIRVLKENNIQCQIGTYASHIQPCYDSTDECPVSLDIYNRSIRLPLHFRLSREEIDFVIHVLKKVKGDVIFI